MLAILDGVQNQQQEIRKERLFASMLSNAWYTVNYFNVSFGQQDLIQTTVKKLKDIEHITIDEQRNVILDKLVQSDRRNKGIMVNTEKKEELRVHLSRFHYYSLRLYFSLGGNNRSRPWGLILNRGPFSTTRPFEFLFIK